jgi:hypothetical protein
VWKAVLEPSLPLEKAPSEESNTSTLYSINGERTAPLPNVNPELSGTRFSPHWAVSRAARGAMSCLAHLRADVYRIRNNPGLLVERSW